MFLGHVHFFRALAIYLIIAGHTIDAFIWPEGSVLMRLLRMIVSNSSILFVFIAGYLFQHLLVKYSTKKYLLAKLKYVITPYSIISIPAIFVFVFIRHRETVWNGFYDNPEWMQVCLFYLTGLHLAPMWFIPMISIFYLLSPLLARADRVGWFYLSLPVLIAVSCFNPRGLAVDNVIHFFSAYILGMACSKYKEQVNAIISKKISLCSLLGLSVTFVVCEFYLTTGTMTFYNYFQKICMALFYLGLLVRFSDQLRSGFVGIIADVSFGVFFIHSYVLTGSKMIYKENIGHLPNGDILSYVALSLSLLTVCACMVLVIKKLLGNKSRYFVGS